jgi:uncharacterized cupin superfamily protein
MGLHINFFFYLPMGLAGRSASGRARHDNDKKGQICMNPEGAIRIGTAQVSLNPSPIHPDWILEGEPIARNRFLSGSDDGTACTLVWDCTAGRFDWYYDFDETVYVVEGSVRVKDDRGVERRVEAGDTIFFPAGTHAQWTVDHYIRKIAFCRAPLPWQVILAKRAYGACKRTVKRLLGRRIVAHEGLHRPALFGGQTSTIS